MIPFVYRLREEVRIQDEEDSSLVVTQTPLNVLRVSRRAARILRLCDGQMTLDQMARETGQGDERDVYRVCDSLNRRGILTLRPAPLGDYAPTVSVIIPTKDRRGAVVQCLESVFSQDYPRDRMDVIVVDDGSRDGTVALLSGLPCTVISQPETRGQSFCRNTGAAAARGEILAFLDSDCVASPVWLKELLGAFRWEEVGAVGGYVDGYFEESILDRYEKTFSSLNMGRHVLSGGPDTSTLYVPACNLLVRRSVYLSTGGIMEDLRVGEDVDLCWRIRNNGHRLLYLPCGPVQHKHRNVMGRMLKRRAEYGTSEAVLYKLHPERKKVLPLPPLATAAFLAICAATLWLSPLPLLVAGFSFLLDSAIKVRKMRRLAVPIGLRDVLFSLARTYLSLFYFASFHLVRYYTLLLLLIGAFFHPLLLLTLWMLLLASITDYSVRKPRLSFLSFLLCYFLEHVAYQAGVFAGCLRHGTFGSYKIVFKRTLR